jgi:hypothetical protein
MNGPGNGGDRLALGVKLADKALMNEVYAWRHWGPSTCCEPI